MDGKKVYQIQINGITESANAVEALNKQLDALSARIKALENSNVKVSAASSGGKGASSSAMNEEAKLAKQIEQIDEKRKAYSKEIYQNYLAAKDVLKETVNDQQQIAAQERLQANAYNSNTMAGMKQELADLKRVMNSTDLGDEKFQEMSMRAGELTQKLKELEEAYGQFGRNVGNYQSAFDGISKVSVNIGGAVKEFDNLKQASKALRDEMGKLEYNGQQDTKMYKQLENELGKVSKAQLRLNSAMNDAKSSSNAMDNLLDTMESFTALGQVGQGFSTLFGLDNTELEQQIAKLVALQNVLQGIEKIRQQMNTKEGIGGWISKGSDAVDSFVMKITGAQKRMGMLVAETRTATLAVQGLSTALKALGGVAVAAGFMALSGALSAIIEDFKKFVNGGYKAGTATDVLSKNVETLNKQYDRLRKQSLENYFNGIVTSEQYATTQTKLYLRELTLVLSKLQEIEKISKSDVVLKMEGVEDYNKALEKAKNRFMDLSKEIDKYEHSTSKFKQWAAEWFSGPIAGINNTKREFQELGEAITHDLLYSITIAQQKATKEMNQYGKVTDETANEIRELAKTLEYGTITNSILDQVDKFSEKGQYYVTQINLIKDGFVGLANSLKPVDVDAGRLAQLNVDKMADGIAKQKAQIELNRKKELADAEGNEKLKLAINEKYNREILDAEKAFGREMAAAYADLQSLRIEAMDEGWAKEKARLIQERDEKIRAVVESEKLVGARREAIMALYNKKIKEAEQQWAAERLKIYEDLANDIQSVNRETFGTEVETALQKTENSYQEKLRNIGKMINQYNYMNLESMKEYFTKVLEATQAQADKEERINQESLDKEYDYEVKAEEKRHDRLVRANGEYAEQLKQGKITKEQYNKLIENEEEAHNARMNAIEKKYAADTVANTQEALDKKEKAYNDYYTNVIAEIRRGQDEIVKLSSKAVVTDTDQKGAGYGFGIVNYKKTKENYQKLIDAQKIAVSKIVEERKKLYSDKEAGNISGEYFKQRIAELDAAEDAALATLKDLETKAKDAFPRFMRSIMVYVQEAMNSFNQIMQAVWNAQDIAFDKEQEQLDKDTEAVKNALDKQKDLVEKYKSSIDSIEDELATSRGDRRQHLIDQLNAEMEAERAAAKEKQRLEKEEEKQKQKQEDLDKKRKKAEYQRNLLQAIVNGAMAVTMAAINTWPLPAIPMMALAASTTAAQIAIMAANKPYAKGGLLEGKSHANGGIPIPGTGIEVEGKEYVIRKKSSLENIDLLDYINKSERKLNLGDFIDFYGGKVKKNIASMSPGRKYADGGALPTIRNDYNFDDRLLSAFEDYSNRPVVVSVVDINNKQDQVRRVQTLAGL